MEPLRWLAHPPLHRVDGQLVLVEKRSGADAVAGHDEPGESGLVIICYCYCIVVIVIGYYLLLLLLLYCYCCCCCDDEIILRVSS